MKQNKLINFQQRTSMLVQRNNQHFRVRSTSKDKFFSTASNEKFFPENQQQKRYSKNSFTQKIKFKSSRKQLRKIIIHQSRERQRSQNFDSCQRVQTNEDNINDVQEYKKITYSNVKTQQDHLNRKQWVDIHSIDTSEDIKMLDRITALCDPFRIINECNSKARLERKSEQQRVKTISAKKSKLTDKINTLVFQMASKSKSKNGFKIHRNKFQTYNAPSLPKSNQENLIEPINPSLTEVKNSPLNSNSPKTLEKVAKNHRIAISEPLPKELQISSQLIQTNKASSNKAFEREPNHLTIKTKYKLKTKQSKNEMMSKFWSEVNQSLILAAQEEYVSKDLNQLIFNNMV